MIRALLAGFVLALAIAASPAGATERIEDYHADLRVLADGSLEVTETIRVFAEGENIRRGIYRDFPLRYRDRAGNRVVVDFELLGVDRDGSPTPHFTESVGNGIRINTGDDSFLEVPRAHTFTIRYRTKRQLGFFAGYDELYWNVTGLGWMFPIGSASADVTLPAPVPAAELRIDAYTGGYGAQGTAWRSQVTGPGRVNFRTIAPLMPQEGLTIVVGFPKGLVLEPTTSQKAHWFLRDNAGVLAGLLGLAGLLLFYLWRWHLVGRDPQAGPVFPLYSPPADLAPGEVRMLRHMGYDNRAFAADVVDMAVRGYLEIHSEGGDWRLSRNPGADAAALAPGQQAIAARLFAGGSDEVELKNTEAARVGGARSAQYSTMLKRLSPRFYAGNGGSLMAGVVLSAVVGLVAFVLAGGNGIPLLFVIGVLGVIVHLVFARLLRAPTKEGRKRLDEIEGLKMYLSVAERDEIRGMAVPGDESAGAPPLDARRYEALLPYAMALDVESAWTDKFTAAVGVEEAQRSSPGWYHGGTMSRMGLAGLGSSLGSALTQQISSSATPPGSSSGGGGGGFSGGGGGGGGGGGR